MKIFKAFAQIGPLVDNTRNVTAPVGELSPMSRTFIKAQPTQHVGADYPNETLVGFSYKNDGVNADLEDGVAAACLKAINWTYMSARTGKFTETKDSFQQAFITNFGGEFDLINSGKMVPFATYYAPEYIEFCPKGLSTTIRWKIWFTDDAFYNQFDEFEILIAPPLTPLDQFFGDYDEVTEALSLVTRSMIFEQISVLKGVFPETVLRNDVFIYQNADDKTLKADTDWSFVIYGAAGDNLDSVKEAARTYILANSSHTRDEWAEIFPDLFTSTEYIFVPLVTNYAIPNGNRRTGIYSPIPPITRMTAIAQALCKGVKYSPEHINRVLSPYPSLYRSVMCAVVGGPENRDGIDLLNERFPDLINVPTTHPDFMSMSKATRDFVLFISEMIRNAEDLTIDSGVPQGFNRIVRDGIVYLARSYDKFLYLVVSKASVEAWGG